ncbi:MAG: energy-coupling factor ABC transporter ATP-binding protein [Actinobacteria bacterium]|nr:energy-coupling factor ABC transporter ATP-binding protein [Actinomycetota bacterium]
MSHPVSVADLHFAYPDGRQALSGVTFSVGKGERLAVLGPNGAGKTTLALHLNGLLRAARGTIRIGDLEVTDDNLVEIRRRVGLVFQDPDDQLFMPTVAEDVAFGPANLGLEGDELEGRVDEALAAVEATNLRQRVPHHLSGGEKRRASLATVLAMDPGVLVFDEPASGLDPAGRRELMETLVGLPVTQVLITHDLPLALELCPRSVILDEGRVSADGPTAGLLGDDELLARHRLEMPYRLDGRKSGR